MNPSYPPGLIEGIVNSRIQHAWKYESQRHTQGSRILHPDSCTNADGQFGIDIHMMESLLMKGLLVP